MVASLYRASLKIMLKSWKYTAMTAAVKVRSLRARAKWAAFVNICRISESLFVCTHLPLMD